MRSLLGALFVSAGLTAGAHALAPQESDDGNGTAPRIAASPSPSPSPRYKLIPYGFETAADRSYVPLLRFEDRAEVRALEMNAAIARFFDSRDDRGNMLRGATPGGAPTLREMANYRPHVAPSLDLLGAVLAVAKGVKHEVRERRGRLLKAPTPDPSASPTPAPSPSPAASPTPRLIPGPPTRPTPD